MPPSLPLPAISMRDLRTQPGTILDRVFYRNERVVIEKAGEPRAVLISLVEYEDMERTRQQARKRFMQKSAELAQAFQNVDPEKFAQELDQAIAEVRAAKHAK